jgi:hypothetical protein
MNIEEGYMRELERRLMGRRAGYALLLLVTFVLSSSSTALAAPPANDTRPNAQRIRLGDRVNGTTVDATHDNDDQFGCGPSDTPSVWYRIDGTTNGRAIADLQAHGDLDVTLDVYLRQRSQFSSLACDNSDRRGRANTDFRMKKGQSYLIRVSQRQQSVSGTFTLTVDIGQPPAQPPGRALPRHGATGTVQRVFEPSNAWSTSLREGTTYRVNLSPESCMQLSIYGPNADSFEGRPRRVLICGGYTQFTPGPHGSGRYSFLIQPASTRRTPQSYRLTVARAGTDDTVPGRFLRNHSAARGSLNANRVDVVDLYRFDVTENSITDLVLRGTGDGDLDIRLLSAGGHVIRCGCDGGADQNIHVRTHPGRYFVAVRAHRHSSARYHLSRASKTITRTSLTITPLTTPPGSSVSLNVGVSPSASGPVTILIERFDPTSGWQFLKRYELRAVNGSTGATFRPPSVGRYRAKAIFPGTSKAAGSKTGWRGFRVQGPLQA